MVKELIERVAQKIGCELPDMPVVLEEYEFHIWPQKINGGYDWVCDVRGISGQEKYEPNEVELLEEVSLEEAGSLLGLANASNSSIQYRGQNVSGKIRSRVREARNQARDFLQGMGYL